MFNNKKKVETKNQVNAKEVRLEEIKKLKAIVIFKSDLLDSELLESFNWSFVMIREDDPRFQEFLDISREEPTYITRPEFFFDSNSDKEYTAYDFDGPVCL